MVCTPPLAPLFIGEGGRGPAPSRLDLEGGRRARGVACPPSKGAPPLGFPLEGRPPCPSPPIYRGVRGGLLINTTQGAAPPLPNTSPPPSRAWRSHAGVLLLHHHHAVVLLLESSSSTSPSPLLDQEGVDVTLTVRVLNAEVPSVRH